MGDMTAALMSDLGQPARPIRVMVVDDSPTIRAWLSHVIGMDTRLHVVAQAGDAGEARELIKETQPDVLTLDLDMPEVNGLEFLTHLMRLRPMPVIVFSGLVAKNRQVALAATKLGAFACIPKPARPDADTLADLCDSLVAASRHRQSERGKHARLSNHIVLIGASTGGVAALETVLGQLTRNDPPVVIAQHMPQRFLESFAERLDRMFPMDVNLATPDCVLEHGSVHVACAQEKQTCVRWHNSVWRTEFRDRAEDDTFCPSVDRLFLSAQPWAARVGVLLLTGIGDDGAKGMLSLLNAGARTVAQSQKSCVVYGMPGAAGALGAAENEVDVSVAGTTLLNLMEERT